MNITKRTGKQWLVLSHAECIVSRMMLRFMSPCDMLFHIQINVDMFLKEFQGGYMIHMRKSNNKILIYTVGALFLLYLCGIVLLNLSGRALVSYDIYSDAILAKYMVTDHSLFPEKWIFGNQIYAVATPAVASLLYIVFRDSYLAIAVASCTMTVLCVLSCYWCVKPFAKTSNIVAGLLVLIGGTFIGYDAHEDWEGLQLFYTMASYYACYIIGIFVTTGCFYRYWSGNSVNKTVLVLGLLYNFGLGIQSLRETLVLNLPLLATLVLMLLCLKIRQKPIAQCNKNAMGYAIAAFACNIGGVITNKFLTDNHLVQQNVMEVVSSAQPRIVDRIWVSVKSLIKIVGFAVPDSGFAILKILGGLFTATVVLITLILIILKRKDERQTILSSFVVFFVIGIMAVFAAGLMFITLRPAYYFCWHLLVAVSVIYMLEHDLLTNRLKKILLACLVCVSLANYVNAFGSSFRKLNDNAQYRADIVGQLLEDDIKYVYSDWRTQENWISTISKDKIEYATMVLSDDLEDFWDPMPYLTYEGWFETENFDNSYIILSELAIQALSNEFSDEYRDAFMSNLELVYKFDNNGYPIYFYKGSERLHHDTVSQRAVN